MSENYVLFCAYGGMNDCFSCADKAVRYCTRHNRTLLIDMTKSMYDINLADFFTIRELPCKIICDTVEVRRILLELKDMDSLSVYPSGIDKNIADIFNTDHIGMHIIPNFHPRFEYGCAFYSSDPEKSAQMHAQAARLWKEYEEACVSEALVEYSAFINDRYNTFAPLCHLPKNDPDARVIFHYGASPLLASGYSFFKILGLTDDIKSNVKGKLQTLQPEYLCIQVRGTDYPGGGNHQELYVQNREYIHSFKQVYLCTDDISALEFFRSKDLQVECFTAFPSDTGSACGLHQSREISPWLRMVDLIVDIFVASNSKSYLSNSPGGFAQLLRDCHENKDWVNQMLE